MYKHDFKSHLLVNHKLKTLHCVIPKAGSSSWKAFYISAMGGILPNEILNPRNKPEFRLYHNYQRLREAGFTQVNGFSKDEIDNILKTYFKYIIVRHPLDRLASAYYDKFRKIYDDNDNYMPALRRGARHIIINHRAGFHDNGTTIDLNSVTFDEFVQYILSGDKRAQNEHWLTYQTLCEPCLVNYDYIATVETHDIDVPQILELMGASKYKFPDVHRNTARPDFYQGFYDNITAETLERLLLRYGVDMEMFGYT